MVENAPLSKEGLLALLFASSTLTHTWRAGTPPARVKVALAETSNGFSPGDLAPKGLASALDHTLLAKPTNSPMESPADFWNKIIEVYVYLTFILERTLRVLPITRSFFGKTTPVSSKPT